MTSAADPPRLISVGLPLAALVVVVGMGAFGLVVALSGSVPSAWHLAVNVLSFENGLIEIATVVVLIWALVVALIAARDALSLSRPLVALWLALQAAGLVYFAGEEISWGQWVLGWETPDWFAARNDQGETNLHNMSSWLDQKPRILVFLWILGGGILVPLFERLRDPLLRHRLSFWLLPTGPSLFVSALAVLIRFPEDLANLSGLAVDSPARLALQPVNLTEVQEYLFAAFFLIYLSTLRRRLPDAPIGLL